MNRLTSRSSGFTLIEILIVVFIIGLLATVVTVNFIGQTDTARRTKAMADLKELEQAFHLFKLDNGFYPTSDQGIAALIQKPGSGPQPRKYPAEGYLNKTSLPEDPWGHPYVYISDGNSYLLRSLGSDGEQGGEGFAADIDSRDMKT
jgi:general secretion pathway protein G